MDEIGFWISCGKAYLVVTIDPNKRLHMIDSKNCDYITSVKCISFTSETILPMLLVSEAVQVILVQ